MRKRPGRNQGIDVREQFYYEPQFFKVYNHVQERYARRVGFQAWGVYTVLKQYAGFKDSRCTVSLARIAITWGCTTRTVQRAIRKLRDFGLIRVKKNQASSTYTILRIPVPKGISRHDKNVVSDTSQMSFQTRQESRIDQTLFTRASLPNDAPVDTPSKRKDSRALQRFRKLGQEIEKKKREGLSLMREKGNDGANHPKVREMANELDEMKRQLKLLGVSLGIYR